MSAPEIEFLLVANHAEAINGLLYISGGGWTQHMRPAIPGGGVAPSHIGIAVSVRVPWSETEKPIAISLDIEDLDGNRQLSSLNGQINVGKPPGVAPGTDQYAAVAANAEVAFPHAGSYRIIARLVEGGKPKHWTFQVHDIPGMPMPAGGKPSG